MSYVTRFAPSPTGPLHLGHAYSALIGYERAQQRGGTFLLRIDDGDSARARPEWEAQIYEDLAWLGLNWPQPVRKCSNHEPQYRDALKALTDMDLTYACTCSRKDIQNALSAPQEGVDGLIYPGTCKHLGTPQDGAAIRLNMEKALAHLGDVSVLRWHDTGVEKTLDPKALIETVGDIVLYRKDPATAAYHLSVVIDDAAQGITEAVRGQDLAPATQIHRLLQALLGLPTPRYHHHALIRDEAGKRLAKRDDARAIAKYREDGLSPQDLRTLVGLA